MATHELTIDDLCAQTELTRRTIRYYLQRGLIPPPEGGGRRRIYGREHLLRLWAIQGLQDRSYPLDEIRHRLARLKEPDLEYLVTELRGETQAPAPRQSPADGEAVPLPPPEFRNQLVVPVVEGVALVASEPASMEDKAKLLEAARRAAEVLRGRPVQWLPHPDPTLNAHMKRVATQKGESNRDSE